ncbi:MAG: guanylate kinase [bacterium]
MNNKAKILVIGAPSGSGKSTLAHYIIENHDKFEFSVSATTREPREGELDGKDYHFLSIDEFKGKIENGEFLEWEEVYPGRFYGTLYDEVNRILLNNKYVVFDMDVVGGINVKKIYEEDCVNVFLKAPTKEEYLRRLSNRGTETPETLSIRLEKIEKELEYELHYDYSIVNDNIVGTKKLIDLIIKHYFL